MKIQSCCPFWIYC